MVDVIRIVLKDLDIHDIHSALLVNREWCRAAVPIYWRAPFSFNKKRSANALKIYEIFLRHESSTSAKSETQKTLPFFDYPSFIRELNYTNLLACESSYDKARKIETILQMLIKRGVRLDALIMDNTGANNERVYGLWSSQCYSSLFSNLIHIEIHTPFPKSNVMRSLAKNCTRLSHIDINLTDTSEPRSLESIDQLEKLIIAQQNPLKLRVVFPNGRGDLLVKALKSRPESFQRLELVKWNFSRCDWNWLKDCTNLIEFAITSPHPQMSQISEIFEDTNHEPYRMKPSKNSKILTEHWHFDRNDEITEKFYFHITRSSLLPYGGEDITVFQPKVRRVSRKKHYNNDYDDFDYFDDYPGGYAQWFECYDPSD